MNKEQRQFEAERFTLAAPSGARFTVVRVERQIREQYLDGNWSNWATVGGTLRTTTGLFVNEWDGGEYEVLTNPPLRPCRRA